MREWIIRHPYAVGMLLAVIVASGTYNAFRSGVAVGALCALDDTARRASEALGG